MQTNNNLYSRIEGLCKITGDTMYSLSKHSGISESALSRLKNSSQANISKKNLILLANYFAVNEDWLSTGKGDPDAPGIVKDTLIRDSSLHNRFVLISSHLYGDKDDPAEKTVDIETMATYTDIPQERLWMIIYNDKFPTYTETLQLLKSDKNIDANWLFLGVGTMFKNTPSLKNTERIKSLVDTISTLQDTINIKSEIIATLNERIKQLENQIK